MVYLLAVAGGGLFLMFYRGKNDPIASNASPTNPKFREELNRYLSLLEEEILVRAIETINFEPN